MKRRTGAAKARETLAETRMRVAAEKKGDNSFNYGTNLRSGAIGRGKHRGRADKAGGKV